jgi:hypothetical protein
MRATTDGSFGGGELPLRYACADLHIYRFLLVLRMAKGIAFDIYIAATALRSKTHSSIFETYGTVRKLPRRGEQTGGVVA